MDLETAIRSRRSIRAYEAARVPRAIIRQVLDQARWSPSWANTQCWNVYVVEGRTLAQVKDALRQAEADGIPPRPDFRMPDPNWPEPLKTYSRSLVQALTAAMPRDPAHPPAGKYSFFDAPCLILVAVDKALAPDYACFDVGLFVQSLCLAAQGLGLGTCILARAVHYPDILRALIPQAAGRAFVIGVSLGRPDPASPLNQFERPRAALEEQVTWIDRT
ncbi:MAG: nitroreductase [Holophaga sp.]